MQAHAHAAAALLSAAPQTPFGYPASQSYGALQAAASLVAAGDERASTAA